MTREREPRDVEARLRASLQAYAEAVDDSPVQRPPAVASAAGTGRTSPPVGGWRVPALVAAAMFAVAGGTWFVLGTTGTPPPTAAPAEQATVLGGDARAEAAPGSDPGPSPGSSAAAADVGPAGQPVVPSPAEVGVAYPFDLYTHCGIVGADVAGVWFAADPPLVEESGPPAGWDDPEQRGTLTLDSADEAVFRDDAGHEVTLRAAPGSERPSPCD